MSFYERMAVRKGDFQTVSRRVNSERQWDAVAPEVDKVVGKEIGLGGCLMRRSGAVRLGRIESEGINLLTCGQGPFFEA